MSIEVQCPDCGQQYRLRDEMAGKTAKCKCGNPITIPAASASPQSGLSDLLDQESSHPAQPQVDSTSSQPSGLVPPAAGGAQRRNSQIVLWVTIGGVGGVLLLGVLVLAGVRLFGGRDAPTSTASGTAGGAKATKLTNFFYSSVARVLNLYDPNPPISPFLKGGYRGISPKGGPAN